jgi:hypothetical protein
LNVKYDGVPEVYVGVFSSVISAVFPLISYQVAPLPLYDVASLASMLRVNPFVTIVCDTRVTNLPELFTFRNLKLVVPVLVDISFSGILIKPSVNITCC